MGWQRFVAWQRERRLISRGLTVIVALFVIGGGLALRAFPLSAQTTGVLLVNEIDYDQDSTDAAEFIEIKNVDSTAIDLDPYALELVNGNGGGAVLYQTIDLPAVMLAAGDYYVVCANPATVANCDLDVAPDTNLIQNGAPDAVAIVLGTTIVDTVSYEGDTGAPYTEGSGSGLEDVSTLTLGGISRFPDGTDTQQNNLDLSPRCITPGEANTAESSNCDGAATPTPTATPTDEATPTDTPVASATPTETATPSPPAGLLLVNEIDYDQDSTDAAEFIEIKNVDSTAIDLDPYALELVNGNGGGAVLYQTIDLPAVMLAAGDYYVVCANPATVANCDLDVAPDTNLIQNGAPDAVAIVLGTTIVDTVSYEGDTGAPYTEGSGSGLEDVSTLTLGGISRFPDGTDTQQNNLDLSPRCITPGEANTAESSNCDGAATPTPTTEPATDTPTPELPTDTPTPEPPTATPTATPEPPTNTPTPTPEPPTDTPTPTPHLPTDTPTPEPPTATPVPGAGGLVINEIDYDQSGTDMAEFLEIRNNDDTEVALRDYVVELVNGNDGMAVVYQTIALPDVMLAAGDYFVVCANAATVANCDLDVDPDTNLIQNGAPDAVALVFSPTLGSAQLTIVDTVSYEGDTLAPYTEGSGVGLEDLFSETSAGISRFPDGVDTQQNNVDLSLRCISPGAPNVADNSNCDGGATPTPTATATPPGPTNTPTATSTPGGPTATPSPTPGAAAALVINEIDYDQASTDSAEFLEIRNNDSLAVNLDAYAVELVNGNGGGAVVYQVIDLPDVILDPGAYYVVCANVATVTDCDLDVDPDENLIQNGAPDAVAIVLGTTIVDVVSYEGNTGAPYTEGSGDGLEDISTETNAGISRFPDGVDTQQNNVDLSLRCISPGAPNVADNSNCDGEATPTPTATPGPTDTPSPTPEPTGTASPTPTTTATPELSPSATPEPSPTDSATPAPTETATATPVTTATATPSPTPTESSAPTATPTETPNPTDTPMPSPTPTEPPTDVNLTAFQGRPATTTGWLWAVMGLVALGTLAGLSLYRRR